jgi:hypothetical protein
MRAVSCDIERRRYLLGRCDGVYPNYVGRYPMAEKRIGEEMEQNPEFLIFLEVCL